MLNLKEPLGGNFCQKAFSNFNSKKTPSQKIKKSVFLKGIKFWLAVLQISVFFTLQVWIYFIFWLDDSWSWLSCRLDIW